MLRGGSARSGAEDDRVGGLVVVGQRLVRDWGDDDLDLGVDPRCRLAGERDLDRSRLAGAEGGELPGELSATESDVHADPGFVAFPGVGDTDVDLLRVARDGRGRVGRE